MPVIYCSVGICLTRRGDGLTFFRCPKDEARCQIWRTQLGFTGEHIFSNITPEQCYKRIKICSLHFTDESFTTPSKQRLNYNAIPTLFLSSATTNAENNSGAAASKVLRTELRDASIQTDSCIQANGTTQTRADIKIDQCCQTSKKISAVTPRKVALKLRMNTIKKQASQIRKRLEVGITLDDVGKFLEDNYPAKSCAFLKNQLSLLNKAPKGCRYTDEFKQFSLSVYFLGPKAYKKLSTVCRLPSKSTLQRFSKHWVINPGFNDFIFRLTELRVRLLQDKAKDCILCLDEISIKSHLFYDISKDKVIGFQEGINKKSADFASNALVLMARGIASSWKQPIAYFFYKTSPKSDELKDILFQSIRKLNTTGLNVLGVVSDQGSNFYQLVKTTLELTEDNPCFSVDEKRLIYMFDVPHLLKSTRNNFFKYKFIFNKKETNKNYLEKMYNFDKTKQYRLAPKLSNDHIFPNNFQKMKVKLATQVFSHSVAVAMFTYIDFNVLPEEAYPTAEFIEKMNTFFDMLNSNTLKNFGAFMGSEKQILFLEEMDNLFGNLKVENYNGKNVTKQLKFIFGWRLTIKAISILFKTLQAKGYKYLFTRNLNQDCLENFFGQIRNCCGHVKNPTSIQFCRAFKKMFAFRYFDQTDGANCMEDINEVLLNITPDVIEQCNQGLTFPRPTYTPLKVFTSDYRNLKTPEGNALVYVTGYFLRKCLLQHSCELCVSFSNSNKLGYKETTYCQLKSYSSTTSGGLVVPFKNIAEYVGALENIFTSKFGELACQENVGKKLKNEFVNVNFDHPCKDFPLEYFISLYTRVRIYFSLKFTNQDIKTCRTKKMNTKLTILQHL